MTSFDTSRMSTPSGREAGCVIHNHDSADLTTLDQSEIIKLFQQHGMLLFRGFKVGEDKLRAFTEKFGKNFISHPSVYRSYVNGDQTMQTVDYGPDPIPLHAEMSYLPPPMRPELAWFYCVRPSAGEGQTIFCDGTQVVSEFPAHLRELFESRQLKYHMKFNEVIWQRYFHTTSPDEASRTLKQLSLDRFFEIRDQELYMDYVTSALVTPKSGEGKAFANNIIFYHVKGERVILFEDGSPIPDSVCEELMQLTAGLTMDVDWQAEDLVMFDNTRVMHGRREIRDGNRLIYTRFCDMAF